jgi:superfamily I DNA/RNA helicase
LADLFPNADGDATDRAQTFHSLVLSLTIRNGLIPADARDDVLIRPLDPDVQGYYADFCDRHGLGFNPDYANPRKLFGGEKATEHTGNLLFAVNDYLTQTCKPPEKWQSASVDLPIPGDRVVALLDAWSDYKRTAADMRLFEHGDYVAEAVDRSLYPDVDVLLVDEFQDLAPLEYQLYKSWRDAGRFERVYIAGDPNQSIYSFRGGTPHYFEHTDINDRITLKTSYRCPETVASMGNAVLSAYDGTDPRGFNGRSPGGTAEWRSLRDKHALRDTVIRATDRYVSADPSVLLLTRTRRQRYRLMDDLKDVGIPFEVLGTTGSVWQGDLQQLLAFLNNLKNDGTAYAWPNVRTMFRHLPDGDQRRAAVEQRIGSLVDADALSPALDGFAGPLDIIDALELPAWKRDVLTNAVDAPASINAGEVRVGTVHTAKGLEAPCVYLFAESTDNIVKRYARNPEFAAEEHRVYYVGTTRASEELYLVERYFNAPTAPPLETLKRQQAVVP